MSSKQNQKGQVRRAPKFSAFLGFGAVLGLIVGLIIGLIFSEPDMINRWIYVCVTITITMLFSMIVFGAIAIFLDTQSVKKPHPRSKK